MSRYEFIGLLSRKHRYRKRLAVQDGSGIIHSRQRTSCTKRRLKAEIRLGRTLVCPLSTRNRSGWVKLTAKCCKASLNLSTPFVNFFEGRASYPKFKSKHDKQSIEYPQNVKLPEIMGLKPRPSLDGFSSFSLSIHRGMD